MSADEEFFAAPAADGAVEAAEPKARYAVDAVILRLTGARGVGKTICPTEAAKALADDEGLAGDAWRGRVKAVRAAAVRLAKRGEVAIYRKGVTVDPDAFKGVYRIGLPPAA